MSQVRTDWSRSMHGFAHLTGPPSEQRPLLFPVLAALPVGACLVILGRPSFGHGHIVAFRTLFFVSCLAWLLPLTLPQRATWRREWPWLRMALIAFYVAPGYCRREAT